jgi:hypothetical protein
VCDASPVDDQDNTFSPDIRLVFQAPTSGTYYARLLNGNPTVAGPDVTYQVSVRRQDTVSLNGAIILVGGRLRDPDSLQTNIHHLTGLLYDLALAHGYTSDRVHYLATNVALPGVDAMPTKANLEWAITTWAPAQVGGDGFLTLYVVDHGGYDVFYLDDVADQEVTPQELDNWLDQFEAARPDARVNLIVEACFSGSFIDWPNRVSQEGRVVIASTGNFALAYASSEGAFFSDTFLVAAGQGMNLWQAFEEGRWAVNAAHTDQTPWLDGDGDAAPNEQGDAALARRRTLFGAAPDLWPPYIVNVRITETQDPDQWAVTATVTDDLAVDNVWAVLYTPSDAPPEPGEELVQEDLQTVELFDPDKNGEYAGILQGVSQPGRYKVAVYARDEGDWQARPEVIKKTVWTRLYLPIIVKQ